MLERFWTCESLPVVRALDAGQSPVLVSGIGAASRAHMAAALCRQMGSPLAVICPDDSAAEAMRRDLEALLSEPVLLLLSREFGFYAADSASRLTEQKRIAALDALARDAAPVTVCTVAALLQRTLPRASLQSASFELAQGQEIDPAQVECELLHSGYVRREQVESVGQYARRGGILDIFSPAADAPVRMEFWGDEIDSMGFFDVASQRRTENVARCRVLPAAEALACLAPGGEEGLSAALEAEAVKTARSRSAERSKLAATLRADAERLRETGELPAADRYFHWIFPDFSCALDYLPADALIFLDQPPKTGKLAEDQQKLLLEDLKVLLQSGAISGKGAEYRLPWADAVERLAEFPVVMGDNFTQSRCVPEPRAIVSVTAKQLPSYGGNLEAACDDVRHYTGTGFAVVVLAGDERRAGALQNFFLDRGIAARVLRHLSEPVAPGECAVAVGALSGGFEYPVSKLVVLTDAQLMQPGFRRGKRKKKLPSDRKRLESYADLSVGDLVVHEYHGIGRFAGIVQMKVDGADKDYVKICYAGSDVLYVPATQLDLVSKYIGAGEDHPVRLSKMGGTDWTRAKIRAKAAAKEMAGELIALYAERKRRPGHAFAPDSPWQTEFEDAFGYEETDDQLRCIAEIKKDMESSAPMDRLLCGDVGYGKTEVSLRAAFKAIADNKQVALLAPTTILVQQHYNTVSKRFAHTGARVDYLSRFRTAKEQKDVLARLAAGDIDIVIGTHRLLAKDVKFKDLGLLIVDEEQRFGVAHKEVIKNMKRQMDVLTLSATPIPRTLHMSMTGIRDMSVLETPPEERIPVQTVVTEYSDALIRDAVLREISRGGQVYFLYNRVRSIEKFYERLRILVPEARIGIAHGQMREHQLEDVMMDFYGGSYDVLLCTTIIENGLDVPSANTLIVFDAERFGLSQLYQLRGRVGRSNRQAYAYFTVRPDHILSETARQRLEAIREFTEFGAGFRIAMRDLEIRGAGNILGPEQHGHLATVGYDMYCKLMEETLNEVQGRTVTRELETRVDLKVDAYLPADYVAEDKQRMEMYKRIASIVTDDDRADVTDELIDRYGDPPQPVKSLLDVSQLRALCNRVGISQVTRGKEGLVMKLDARYVPDPALLLQAIADTDGRLVLSARAPAALMLKDPKLQERDACTEALRVMRKLTGRLKELEEKKKAEEEAAAAENGESKP